MSISPGTVLISTPAMDDPEFWQAVLLITEYNAAGAMGFVMNKPFPRAFNELVEFRHCAPFPYIKADRWTRSICSLYIADPI